MKIDFYLRFHTKFGQALAITGNLPSLGDHDLARALQLKFLSDELWHTSIEIDPDGTDHIHYRYIFINEKGEKKKESEKNRIIDLKKDQRDVVVLDSWNDESYIENVFYTAAFTEVFLKPGKKTKPKKSNEFFTHQFRVKASFSNRHHSVCMLGSDARLNNWKTEAPLILHKKGNWWIINIDLTDSVFPISYKYGIYDQDREEFIRFEEGDNRVIHNDGCENKLSIIHDGFANIGGTTWKGCGVAIPVFSLKSTNSFGIGEFTDIKLLVDWASETGLRMIQLLPVNDTSGTYTWKDSYPYAAISAFALHPIYINVQKVGGKKSSDIIKSLSRKQKQLNQLPEIDYEQVIHFKINILKELFEKEKMGFIREEAYQQFFEENKIWLVPYAAFCYFRDKYHTSDFSAWKSNETYDKEEIERISSPKSKVFRHLAFYYYVQYHLHLQLKEAADYAHKKGIAFKGDIPIGIYRYGCDAWTSPELYNMNMQAGAPPDDFTIKGQNWGFPTYNWKKMEEDHFEWWRLRFHQMSNYFDAFRIDHILGFFRIWSIPIDSIEGILGRFIPALPVSVTEFGERGIWFDYDRFCKPYITNDILNEIFGEHTGFIKDNFISERNKVYELKEEFDTQQKLALYFDLQDDNEENKLIKQGLFDLITNVLLFEQAGSHKKQFHFRILIENTSSFQQLDVNTRNKIKDLYVDYFYRRQDEFWKTEAMNKLPELKDATHMLICGEDLGMVPHCVPDVMKQLGILSLEIQRMPKDIHTEFFHPKDAPYLSVITPSTHDMSTIRGWWEENREKTQRFYNSVLGEHGSAPYFCEPWINRAIILQHLYSPAMLSIFQLQDILGMSENLRRLNPSDERINDPANTNHYWNYRMHLTMEQLLKEKEFNKELKDYILNSGRA